MVKFKGVRRQGIHGPHEQERAQRIAERMKQNDEKQRLLEKKQQQQ